MPMLKVTYSVPGTDVKQLFLDDEEMFLDGDKAEKQTSSGKHVLRWRARGGRPNTEYTIKITAPESAVWEPDPPKRTRDDGSVVARHTFVIT